MVTWTAARSLLPGIFGNDCNPEGEPVIASSNCWAYDYADHVIGGEEAKLWLDATKHQRNLT